MHTVLHPHDVRADGLQCASLASRTTESEDNSGQTPGFFERRIHGKCGDLTINGTTLSGEVQGHAMSFKWDRQNRLVEYVIDGARWTGFLDDAGHVTELRDAQNNSHAPVRLTAMKRRRLARHFAPAYSA